MENIEVSDCTSMRLQELKKSLYGGDLNDDTFLLLLAEEILDDERRQSDE